MLELITQKIGAGIITIGLLVSGMFGNNQPILGGTFSTPEVRALFTTSLASKITSSATSMTLVSATDKDGNTLASSTYGFIIDEGTSVEEFVLADCTGTACTNLKRGISVATATTTVSALQFEHRRGASVKITTAPSLIFLMNVAKGKQNLENRLTYNTSLSIATSSNVLVHAGWVSDNFIDNSNTETISGSKTFSATTTFSQGLDVNGRKILNVQTPTATTDVANKSYVDGVVTGGAADANTTTKGLSEEATVPEIDSKSSTGGTGAKLFMTPASFAQSRLASTTLYMASTTSSTYQAILNIAMLSGDIMRVWGNADPNCTSASLVIKYKLTNFSASTTLDTQQCAGNNNLTSLGVLGYFTATTTSTLHVDLSMTGSFGSKSTLLVEVLGKP